MNKRKGGEFRIDPISGLPDWWTKEDIAMEHLPRCDRCGLQLPHDECIPDPVDIVLRRMSEQVFELSASSVSRRKGG